MALSLFSVCKLQLDNLIVFSTVNNLKYSFKRDASIHWTGQLDWTNWHTIICFDTCSSWFDLVSLTKGLSEFITWKKWLIHNNHILQNNNNGRITKLRNIWATKSRMWTVEFKKKCLSRNTYSWTFKTV